MRLPMPVEERDGAGGGGACPALTASDVSERTEWLAREMFRAFAEHQAEITVLFSGSRQGLFIRPGWRQAMCHCIAQTAPHL